MCNPHFSLPPRSHAHRVRAVSSGRNTRSIRVALRRLGSDLPRQWLCPTLRPHLARGRDPRFHRQRKPSGALIGAPARCAAIPLAIMLPALVYSIWLFEYHPIFQILVATRSQHPIHALAAHPDVFPTASSACWPLAESCNSEVNPLSLIERFLLVWFVGIFFCVHLGSIIPALGFSPQNSIPLFAPLVLFTFSLRLRFTRFSPRTVYCRGRRSAGYWQRRRPGPISWRPVL